MRATLPTTAWSKPSSDLGDRLLALDQPLRIASSTS
jgi:hypothetical protein